MDVFIARMNGPQCLAFMAHAAVRGSYDDCFFSFADHKPWTKSILVANDHETLKAAGCITALQAIDLLSMQLHTTDWT